MRLLIFVVYPRPTLYVIKRMTARVLRNKKSKKLINKAAVYVNVTQTVPR